MSDKALIAYFRSKGVAFKPDEFIVYQSGYLAGYNQRAGIDIPSGRTHHTRKKAPPCSYKGIQYSTNMYVILKKYHYLRMLSEILCKTRTYSKLKTKVDYLDTSMINSLENKAYAIYLPKSDRIAELDELLAEIKAYNQQRPKPE